MWYFRNFFYSLCQKSRENEIFIFATSYFSLPKKSILLRVEAMKQKFSQQIYNSRDLRESWIDASQLIPT